MQIVQKITKKAKKKKTCPRVQQWAIQWQWVSSEPHQKVQPDDPTSPIFHVANSRTPIIAAPCPIQCCNLVNIVGPETKFSFSRCRFLLLLTPTDSRLEPEFGANESVHQMSDYYEPYSSSPWTQNTIPGTRIRPLPEVLPSQRCNTARHFHIMDPCWIQISKPILQYLNRL
jgi:hypothetical protein